MSLLVYIETIGVYKEDPLVHLEVLEVKRRHKLDYFYRFKNQVSRLLLILVLIFWRDSIPITEDPFKLVEKVRPELSKSVS